MAYSPQDVQNVSINLFVQPQQAASSESKFSGMSTAQASSSISQLNPEQVRAIVPQLSHDLIADLLLSRNPLHRLTSPQTRKILQASSARSNLASNNGGSTRAAPATKHSAKKEAQFNTKLGSLEERFRNLNADVQGDILSSSERGFLNAAIKRGPTTTPMELIRAMPKAPTHAINILPKAPAHAINVGSRIDAAVGNARPVPCLAR